MITLIQKERKFTTPWCLACAAAYKEDTIYEETCEYCQGFLVTYHRCPECSQLDHFFGYDNPTNCSKCDFKFPDLEHIKNKFKERVYYHLDESFI